MVTCTTPPFRAAVRLNSGVSALKIVSAIRSFFDRSNRGWWTAFSVEQTEVGFTVIESGRKPSNSAVAWSDIQSVCFVDGGLGSDCFYIHTTNRPDPVMVPTEATGGLAFWETLKQRNLFPPEISGQAVRSTDQGSQLWWPPKIER